MKSELEKKLNALQKIESEHEEYSESYESLFKASSFLSYVTAGFSFAALYLYSEYGSSFSSEIISLPKFGFEFSIGCAGGIGALNSLFLFLTGMEYSGLKDIRKERNKLREEYKKLMEDYEFSH